LIEVILQIIVDWLICSFGLDSAGPGLACNIKPTLAISIFSHISSKDVFQTEKDEE
jgi:hypothetical protein